MEVEIQIDHEDPAVAGFLLGQLSQTITSQNIGNAIDPPSRDGSRKRQGDAVALAVEIISGSAAFAHLMVAAYDITIKRRALARVTVKGGKTLTIDPSQESMGEVLDRIKAELADELTMK